MEKVMILGAGRGQIGLYKAAKRLGYKAIAVSIDGDYPGFRYADEKYIVDIKDAEGVAALAEEIHADGIVTACMDAGLDAIGAACDRCGMPGITAATAAVSANKLLMKDAFMKEGVRTARYMKVTSEDDLPAVLEQLEMPLITKAVDLGGSRGINVVLQEEDLTECFRKTMEATGKDYCIIEEFLEGYECSATSFVADGKVLFVLPTGDLRYGENDEVPVGHYLPYECSASLRQDIEEQVVKGIKAIGLDNCAVNVDIMIKDDQAYILELTGRLGANCIPELTSVHYGFDIHELIVETAVGNFGALSRWDFGQEAVPCIGRLLISEESGIFRGVKWETGPDGIADSGEQTSVDIADSGEQTSEDMGGSGEMTQKGISDSGEQVNKEIAGSVEQTPCGISDYDDTLDPDSDIAQFWIFKDPGDRINKFRNPGDGVGQVVIKGESVEECRRRLDQVEKSFSLMLE